MRLVPDAIASFALATATALPTDDITQWVDVTKNLGVVAAILLYFMVRDYLRHQADQVEKIALATRIDNLQITIANGYKNEMQNNQEHLIKAKETHKALMKKFDISHDDSTDIIHKRH